MAVKNKFQLHCQIVLRVILKGVNIGPLNWPLEFFGGRLFFKAKKIFNFNKKFKVFCMCESFWKIQYLLYN